MPSAKTTTWLWEEIADFLATCPNREQLLQYRPSAQAQKRASELLEKQRDDRLTAEEQRELEFFGHAETLFQLVKARLRSGKGARP